MISNCVRIIGVGAFFCGAGMLSAEVLIDFPSTFKSEVVQTQDARVANVNGSVQVATGHQQPWPGITLHPEQGRWDLSKFSQLTVELRNAGSKALTVNCRVDNPGADGVKNCVNGSLELKPGASGTLKVDLKRGGDDKLGGKLFGMRGYPVGPGGSGGINPSNITGLILFVDHPKEDKVFEVGRISSVGTYVPPTASVTDATPFFPFIDTFGQYKHKDWPGKVKSLEDLKQRRTAESQELAGQPGPADWDVYGGWKSGPPLKGTGFFRTEKYLGRWWLVDPDGRLFFSQGVDCIPGMDSTPIAERADWFEDLPGNLPDFKQFNGKGYALHGHYSGKTVDSFSFAGANLLRKYGTNWRAEYNALTHQRLRSWGLNTIANWSDTDVRKLRHTAYTDTIGSDRVKMIEGSEGYWGKFPDVFDPGFRQSIQRAMESKKDFSAGDPWCIGYFSDNEMSWGDEISLAVAALKSPPGQAAKEAFISDLKAKYTEIEKLNQAWGTNYSSWKALDDSRQAPDLTKARADLQAFYTRVAEEYFRVVRDSIKAVAPSQLYLGCRFAWVNSRAAAAAAKYCDVVSYNLYQRSVADFQFNGGADVPLIIGEFHFGALDRGMFHTGLVPVASQAARAQAYKDYVTGALKHPGFVGVHWFQWMDEPTTGRVYDEENYQIGFVDVADTPYPEMVSVCRELGTGLYKTRLGQ